MKAETFDALRDGEAFDWVVVGSGFGGSVAALRLAEKGYSVAVLEAGRNFEDDDFPRTNWNLPRYLWAPRLGCFGIQRLDWLGNLFVLSGAGLGGGSLVYASTLLEPGEAFYRSCARLGPGLRERLAPHFQTAKRMLGVAESPRVFAADEALAEAAADLGRGGTFQRSRVGVFFGSPGETVPDPYFAGEGPAREGCRFCGGCMVGCRHNAKNTLVKNYLHLAGRRGVRFFTLSTATRLSRGPEGLLVGARRSGWGLRTKTVRAKRLVLAAGVLGTMRLLLEHGAALGASSPALGCGVRTNGEQLLGAVARDGRIDWSQGLAIASGVWADDETHVEAVRYPAGSDAMGLLAVGRMPWPERLRWALPFGWARRATILLAMQTRESRQRLRLTRFGLRGELEPGQAPPPARLPSAEALLKRFCAHADAAPMTTLFDALLGAPTTAHVLGGACRAAAPTEGACRPDGRLWGAEDVWVLDGAGVPGNLGVNPSLAITALAEDAMGFVEKKA